MIARDASPPSRHRMPSLKLAVCLAWWMLSWFAAFAYSRDLPDAPPSNWAWYYGLTPAQVAQRLEEHHARLVSLQVERAAPIALTVAMVENAGPYAKSWWWYYGQSEADLAAQAKAHNARIVNLDAYEEAGQVRFAAILVSNTGPDATEWWWYYDQTPQEIGALLSKHEARLLDLRRRGTAGAEKFAAVMVRNTGAFARSSWWYQDIAAAEVGARLQEHGAHLVALRNADAAGSRFDVVMEKGPAPGGLTWSWYYGIDAAALTNIYTFQGAWIESLTSYEASGRRLFAAVMYGGFLERPRAVTTYHYDNQRTGWNPHETVLDVSNVKVNTENTSDCGQGGKVCFGLLHNVLLDEQVDAQPLFVNEQKIKGHPGRHDVAYVATENNSIYAVDSQSGQVLLAKLQLDAATLGPAVPIASLPKGPYSAGGPCNNNSDHVGIDSTPVIDAHTRTMYVVSYHLHPTDGPSYYLHALDLETLDDRPGSPRKIEASARLTNGATVKFDAAVQRQRPGLLATAGNVYAGFGSFCDYDENRSRGWLMGWRAADLLPLPAVQLDNRDATSSGFCTPWNLACFLSSIWMSGYGLAADKESHLYFVTGNSAPGTYAPNDNVQESVVKVPHALTGVSSLYTPFRPQDLDGGDNDFGSGGVMVLPDQGGLRPRLAVAAGKDGNMYLLDRDDLGGLSTSSTPATNVGPAYPVGSCWCGPSYFVGSDFGSRVVSSGGSDVKVWKLDNSVATTLAPQISTALAAGSLHDGGSFTSVSSDGFRAGTAIIWAVDRPWDAATHEATLYAIDARTGAVIFGPSPAGTWPNPASNPNIVPVVADGKVFVASYRQLAIFGLGVGHRHGVQHPPEPEHIAPMRMMHGRVVEATDGGMTVRLRGGNEVKIDTGTARRKGRAVRVSPGDTVGIVGAPGRRGDATEAFRVFRVERPEAEWPADR